MTMKLRPATIKPNLICLADAKVGKQYQHYTSGTVVIVHPEKKYTYLYPDGSIRLYTVNDVLLNSVVWQEVNLIIEVQLAQ